MAEPVRIAASFNIGQFRNAPPELVEAIEADSAASEADIAAADTCRTSTTLSARDNHLGRISGR